MGTRPHRHREMLRFLVPGAKESEILRRKPRSKYYLMPSAGRLTQKPPRKPYLRLWPAEQQVLPERPQQVLPRRTPESITQRLFCFSCFPAPKIRKFPGESENTPWPPKPGSTIKTTQPACSKATRQSTRQTAPTAKHLNKRRHHRNGPPRTHKPIPSVQSARLVDILRHYDTSICDFRRPNSVHN